MAYKYIEYQKQWIKDNPDKLTAARHRYHEKYPAKRMFKGSKNNARARGISHNIVIEDIVIPKVCPYLGIELTCKPERIMNDATMSLDRIDSSKGYEKDNIQVISRLANLMKSRATEEQLITFAKSVLRIHGKE